MTPPIAATSEPAVLVRHVRPETRSAPRVANARVPRHVASVVDQAAPLSALIDGALSAGIEFLSLQIAGDVRGATEMLRTEGAAFVERGVRFVALTNMVVDVEQQTALNTLTQFAQPHAHAARLTVTIAIGYDTKRDIAQAAASVRNTIEFQKTVLPSAAEFQRHMAARDLPAIDLFLQSAGSRKLSAFLLWHAAYAELGFMRASWSEFNGETFRAAMNDYATRTRTFGAVPQKA